MDIILVVIGIIWFLVSQSKKLDTDEKKTSSSSSWGETLSGMGRDLADAAGRAGESVSRAFKTEEGDKAISAAELRRSFAGEEKKPKRPPTGREVEAEHERRHAAERRRSEQQWAEARKKQADALRVHATGVDSCEGRLESLKVLYDAGILDREEYAERVARVKARHRANR